MPCATARACSQHLTQVLPCFPRPRGTLGQVSSPFIGSCGPITAGGVVAQAAAEAPRGPRMRSMRSRSFTPL